MLRNIERMINTLSRVAAVTTVQRRNLEIPATVGTPARRLCCPYTAILRLPDGRGFTQLGSGTRT